MGIRVSPGFTIIEVMLFLAITGLMIAGIMASATGSLNAQRYRDGVEAIRNSISAEYAKVYSLTNVQNSTDPCSAPAAGPSLSTRAWGTSDCLYSGRLIEITAEETDQEMRVYPVTAKEITNPSDDDLMNRFEFRAYTASELVETRRMDWSLSVVQPGTSNTLKRVAVLILRSPADGTVVTYDLLASNPSLTINDVNPLNERMNSAALSSTVEFCVADLNGPLDPGIRQAIVINRSATSAGDVESRMGDGTWGTTC